MSSTTTTHKNKNQKITNYTTKLSRPEHNSKSTKRPISPTTDPLLIREPKRQAMDNIATEPMEMEKNDTAHSSSDLLNTDANNTTLNDVLAPLISEFRQLHESVDTVHHDYADLKKTISKQKTI